MAKKEMTFEQAKEKLDGIVEKLSDGNLPIEEMVKLYEEGAGLSRYWLGLLAQCEGRLEKVDSSLSEV